MTTKDELIAELYPNMEVMGALSPELLEALGKGKANFLEFKDKMGVEDLDWDSITAFLVMWQVYGAHLVFALMLAGEDEKIDRAEMILSRMLSLYTVDLVLDWQAKL